MAGDGYPSRELELSAGAVMPEWGDLASDLMESEGGVMESLVELEEAGGVFFSFGGVFVSDSELVTIGFPWADCWRTFALRFLNQTYNMINYFHVAVKTFADFT